MGVGLIMEQLTTATGKKFDVVSFTRLSVPEQLYIRVVNSSLVNVVTVFSNPAETVQLWFEGEYAAQYTKLVAIIPEGDAVRVVLGKE